MDLVVGSESDQEAYVAVPAEEHPQVVVDPEGPVPVQVARELMGPEQCIQGICCEASERSPQQLITRRPQLARPPQETG